MTTRRWRPERTDGLARACAILIWLASLALLIGTLVAWATRGFPPQPSSWAQGAIGVTSIAMTAVVYTTVAAALTTRSPRNPIGWILLVTGVSMTLIIPLNASLESVLHSVQPVPLPALLIAWAAGSALLPAAVAALITALVLFPTGRPSDRSWKVTVGLAWVGFVLVAGATALHPEGLIWYPTLPNPIGPPAAILPAVTLASALGVLATIIALSLAAVSMARRYRHAHDIARRQIAWVSVGAAAMTLGLALLYVVRYVGQIADGDGQRVMFVAAVGSIAFALTLLRFVTVTASHGVEVEDLTFLFTDVHESTAMYERVGDADAWDLVRHHFAILESVTGANGGVIVKTIGDAVMARFTDPAAAVRTAIEIQRRIDKLGLGGLRLRVGLHRGPAIAATTRDRLDYFGQTVNTAARIQAAAQPGQIVLSDDVFRGAGVAELLAPLGFTTRQEQLRGVSTQLILYVVSGATAATAVVATAEMSPTAPETA